MRGFRPYRTALAVVLGLCAACAVNAATSVPESRTIRNWRAFTRLYGYVRWFHPSDEAAATDWDALAVLGVRRVRDAANDAALRRELDALFRPIAPTLVLYEGTPPPAATLSSYPEAPRVAWQHQGVAWGASTSNYSPYKSGRTNRDQIASVGFGTVTASVDAPPLRGRTVRLRCAMRAEVASGLGTGQMWLRVDLPGQKMGFFDNMNDRPVTSPEWQDLEITGTVDSGAVALNFGAFLQGIGAVEVDDFRLEAKRPDGSWETVAIQNGGFEDGSGSAAPGWYVPISGGYHGTILTKDAHEGRQSIRISSDSVRGELFATVPGRDEWIDRELVPGLKCRLPLSLPSVDQHTMPRPDSVALARLRSDLDSVGVRSLTPADEAVRVAGICEIWNLTQHFWPYFDVVRPDWNGALDRALARATHDRNSEEHALTLRLMTALLQDGHVNVRRLDRPAVGWTPLTFEWAERQIVVGSSGDSAIRRGDVVRSIDGRDAKKLLDSLMTTRSGTERWRRNQALRLFDRGDPGSLARLEIARAGKTLHVAVQRSTTPAVLPRTPDAIAQLEPGIWYVDLERSRMGQIDSVMTDLAAAKGVVFDARGYPNGTHPVLSHLTDRTMKSAIWRVPRVIRPDHLGPAEWDTSGRWTMLPTPPRLTGRIVFLIGPGAISYAESVLGIVEAYHLGERVGESTAGTNGNINQFTLAGGMSVVWTGMRVLKHDGSEHMGIGIKPTIPVAATISGIRSGRDEVLDRGLAIARGSETTAGK